MITKRRHGELERKEQAALLPDTPFKGSERHKSQPRRKRWRQADPTGTGRQARYSPGKGGLTAGGGQAWTVMQMPRGALG